MPDTGGRFPLPYPVPADPLGDGAAAMQALAEAQHYANGLILSDVITLSATWTYLTVAYGITFSDVPTVFVTHQPNVGAGGFTGAVGWDFRISKVENHQCTVVAIDSTASFPQSAGFAIWVVPPPA